MVRLRRFLICLVCFAGFSGFAGAEIPVGGQVVGPDGRGLPGIRVGLEPIPPDFERVATRLGGDVGPGLEVEEATDADGFFELAAPRLGAWKVVVAGEGDGELTDAAPAYVAEEYLLRPLTGPTELPPIALQPASALEIEVVDENGKPADARLGLSDRRRGRDGWRSRLRLARTGEDGVVRLPLGAEEEPRLTVLGPSHPTVVLSGGELRGGVDGMDGRVGLRLARGIAGSVFATDRRGQAVAGAVAYQGSGVVPLGYTDEEGRLRLVVAAPDREPFGVSFVTRDGLLGHLEPRFSPGEKNVAEVVLEPLAKIHGQVVDLETRDPLAGALVWVPGGPVALTDRGGRYELRLFPVPYWNVQAVAPGYAMGVEGKKYTGEAFEQGPTIALARAASVSGSVVDGEGNPLAGVEVSVRSENLVVDSSPAFRRGLSSTRSSRRGQFHLSGLPLSGGLELHFRKAGFAPSRYRIEGLEAFEERSGLEIVLGAGKSGVGWVVDVDDAPVAGAGVRLLPVEPKDPIRAVYRWNNGNETDLPSSRTDAEGRFRFSHLAAGRYNLEVEAPGFAPFTVPGLAVDAGPGEKDFGTVVLEPGVGIEGVVVDPQGSPIAGAEVRAGRQDRFFFVRRSEPVATSDGSGRFAVADLEAGKQYQVTVSKSGFSSETANVVAKEGEEIKIELRPAGAVSGRVENEDGDPVEGATVFAEALAMTRRHFAGNLMQPARTDDQGAFRLEGVDPGAVHLSVHAEGYQRYEARDLEVPSSGELSGLEIVLVRGATIVGTVSRSDGTPAVGAMVTYATARESSNTIGGFQASGQTDGEGRYRIDGVAPGPAVVQAMQDGHSRASESVEVGSGTQTVDLTFEAGFEVSGRVSDATGAAVAGAALTLTATEAGRTYFSMRTMSPVLTGSDGTFTLKDVAAGRYLLSAAKEGYAQAVTPAPFEVSDGPVTGIELELSRGATLRGRIFGLEADDLASVVIHAFGGTAGAGAGQMGLVDFEGGYSVPSLGPGSWQIVARIEASGRQAAGQVTVEKGQAEAELDLEFKTGYTLEGVVRTAGEPQPGIHVSAIGLEMGLGYAQAVSDSHGRFGIPHLPAGKYRLMAVGATAQHSQEVEVPAAGEVVVELGVQRISGHVFDETGERALAGAAVRIEHLEAETFDLLLAGTGRSTAATDSRGFFSLSAREGVYRVIATKAGYGPAETTVEVAAGRPQEGLELRLLPTEGITFDLLPESGVMPIQVSAAVFDPSGQLLTHGSVPVGEGGTVRFSTVPAGTWELAVQAGDSAVVRTRITAPGYVGQIRLSLGGALRIQVAALAGRPTDLSRTQLPWVELIGPDGRPHYMLENMIGTARQQALWNGEATIPRLVPGPWKFTVRHPDGRTWSGEAVVVAGQTSEVVVP